MNYFSDKIRPLDAKTDLQNVFRFNDLQKYPFKNKNIELFKAAIHKMPELNIIITDENGLYAQGKLTLSCY